MGESRNANITTNMNKMNTIMRSTTTHKSFNTSMEAMEDNLYQNFHEMRKYIQSADPPGVQGTRVKTFQGRPGD